MLMQEKYLRCKKCNGVDFVRSNIHRFIERNSANNEIHYEEKEYQSADPKIEYRCINCQETIIHK